MASKTNCTKGTNGNNKYYRITRVVGHEKNDAGKVVAVRKDFYGTCKKDAEEQYQAYLEKKNNNIDTKKRHFGVEADEWLDIFLAHDNSLSINTIRLYTSTWCKYVRDLDFYIMPLNEVSAKHIQKAYNTLFENGVPTSSIQIINKVMRRFFNYCVQEKMVPYNFINSLSVPKVKKEKKHKVTTWTDEELDLIMNSFDKAQNGFRLRFLLVMANYTGMRISELLGLRYDDIVETETGYEVNVERQVTEVTTFKNNKIEYSGLGIKSLKTECSYRTIPLNSTVMKELEIHRAWHRQEAMKNGYIGSFSYIFTTDKGNLYDKHNCDDACRRYYKRIGVPYKSFHVYRHTFGTRCFLNGIKMKTASALLGHKDERITSIYYVGEDENEKRRAVELMERIS